MQDARYIQKKILVVGNPNFVQKFCVIRFKPFHSTPVHCASILAGTTCARIETGTCRITVLDLVSSWQSLFSNLNKSPLPPALLPTHVCRLRGHCRALPSLC